MKRLVASAAISLTLAACVPATSSPSASATVLAPRSHFGRFTMRMTFRPAPPKAGFEKISVTVTDPSGSGVDDAVVTAARRGQDDAPVASTSDVAAETDQVQDPSFASAADSTFAGSPT